MLNIEEAKRCLKCKIPKCVQGCPINNRIPEFIEQAKEGKYEEAYKIIREVSPLGAICGRVCPHENQCQGSCVQGIKSEPIKIGKIESEICDWARKNKIKINYNIEENNKKIAIIGAGPSGIACAVDLRKLGYDVTIYERENYLGGILMYGIPEYRLPKELVTEVIQDLLDLGIKVELNTILSSKVLEKNESKCDKKFVTIESLFNEGYKAIYLGIGSETSNILPIEGKELNGVYGANEFLKESRECKGKKVIVIGGGNVAMDSARVAQKEGADVTVVYRKQKENMPANKDEIEAANHDGVKFIFGTNIIKILGNEKVNKVQCDTGLELDVDQIIMAIGSTPNKKYIDERLELTEQGLIKINETYETSIENVFAGGDLVQKKATVCMAIKNGKEAGKAINKKICNMK